jgi:hypothetical protein
MVENRNPAPLAAGRASETFCSAAERWEDTPPALGLQAPATLSALRPLRPLQIHGRTEVESAEGELVALGDHRGGAAAPSIADKISFYGELLWIARERGHKPGWVGFKFKERFGSWPNDPRVRSATPRPASLKTKNWIVSRRVAFAKARGRAAHG